MEETLQTIKGFFENPYKPCNGGRLMDYRTNASMIRSVEDVTDPTNNSINEKCARIRRAFTKELGSLSAASYCIMGPRGDAKRIALDRDLVKKM